MRLTPERGTIALDDMNEANGTVVYVGQYSAEPILSVDGSRPRLLAEPLLVAGERVDR
jgi:hypothetical protein